MMNLIILKKNVIPTENFDVLKKYGLKWSSVEFAEICDVMACSKIYKFSKLEWEIKIVTIIKEIKRMLDITKKRLII